MEMQNIPGAWIDPQIDRGEHLQDFQEFPQTPCLGGAGVGIGGRLPTGGPEKFDIADYMDRDPAKRRR